MCIDAHITGKNTLAGFRSLFTFTGALISVMNNSENYLERRHQWPDFFENIEVFQAKLIQLPVENPDVPLDFAALPSLILSNLSTLPKLFRQMQPESYYGKDVDLHIQLATNVSIMLNKRIKNPHARVEMITFLVYLVPRA